MPTHNPRARRFVTLHLVDDKNGTRRTIGLCSCYGDNALLVGTKEFEIITEETLKMFESKPRTLGRFDFYGFQIYTFANATFARSQRHYFAGLIFALLDAGFDDLQYARELYSCLMQLRSNYMGFANKPTQITLRTFSADNSRLLNKSNLCLLTNPGEEPRFGRTDLRSAHILVYTDASYASNDDLSSQIRV